MFRRISLMLLLAFSLMAARADAFEPDSDPQEAVPSSDEPSPEPSAPSEPATAEPADADSEPAATDSHKYELKYKFAKGEVVASEVVHQAIVQTTIQGTSQTAETHSTSQKQWRVTEVKDDGTVIFVHMVTGIDMRQKIQGRREIRYNSETDEKAPPGYEDVAAAVNVPLTVVTMNDRGQILKRLEKRPPTGAASTQMTMPLPENAIGIGETWTSPVEIEVSLKDGTKKKMKTRQMFTLKKVVEDVATIEVDSQILTPVSDPAIEAQIIQRMSNGTVRFDIAQGRVIDQQLDLDRNVIGFSGPASSMHYVTRFHERLTKSYIDTAAPAEKSEAPAAAKPSTKKRR